MNPTYWSIDYGTVLQCPYCKQDTHRRSCDKFSIYIYCEKCGKRINTKDKRIQWRGSGRTYIAPNTEMSHAQVGMEVGTEEKEQ